MPRNGRKSVVAVCGTAIGLFGLGGIGGGAWANTSAPTSGTTTASAPTSGGTASSGAGTTAFVPGATVSQVARHHGTRHHHHQFNGLRVRGFALTFPAVTGTGDGAQSVHPEEANEAPEAQVHEQESETGTSPSTNNSDRGSADTRPKSSDASPTTSATTPGTSSDTRESDTTDSTTDGSTTSSQTSSGDHADHTDSTRTETRDSSSTGASSRDNGGSNWSSSGR